MKLMDSASKKLQKKIDELMQIKYKAVTILEKCKSCGTCITFCPLNLRIFGEHGKAITISSNRSCGGCSVCFHRCPNNAITLVTMKIE